MIALLLITSTSSPLVIGLALLVLGWLAGSIAIAGGLGLWGTSESAGAQTQAANTQAQAALQAANIQAQSQAQALQFAKQTAAQNVATQNAVAQANYGQWAAQQNRLSNFGVNQFGLPERQLPAYVPIPTTPGAYGAPYGLNPDGTPITPPAAPANPSNVAIPRSATVPPASAGTGNTFNNYVPNA